MSDVTGYVYPLRSEQTHPVTVTESNVAVFGHFVERVRIEWMVHAGHYSPTHSVNFVCNQRTLAS